MGFQIKSKNQRTLIYICVSINYRIIAKVNAKVVIFNDSSTASGNYFGTNNIYSIPESLLEAQHKYIQKLEKEIAELVKENTELKMLIKP